MGAARDELHRSIAFRELATCEFVRSMDQSAPLCPVTQSRWFIMIIFFARSGVIGGFLEYFLARIFNSAAGGRTKPRASALEVPPQATSGPFLQVLFCDFLLIPSLSASLAVFVALAALHRYDGPIFIRK